MVKFSPRLKAISLAEWDKQPDPLIDDYLALLERWGLSDIEIRNRELRVKMFEVWMLGKGLSVHETQPLHVRSYLTCLIARSGSVVCLRRHWIVLREYFDFLVWKGYFHKNPATVKTWPSWGFEHLCRDKNLVRDPLAGMKEAKPRLRPKIYDVKKPPG